MSPTRLSALRTLAWIAFVAGVYFAAAKFCIELPVREGELTALWLPSGVALAAVLLGGRWMLVGVFIGDVITSLVGDLPLAASLGFAVGDSAEALVAAVLLLWATGGAFKRVRDVFALVPIIAIACSISASVGTAILYRLGYVGSDWETSWLLYWSSTATGIVLVAPAILAWTKGDAIGRSFLRQAHPRRVAIEVGALSALLVLVCVQVFLTTNWELLGLFLIFPLFSWATVRFGQQGATTSVLLVAAFGVWGSARNSLELGAMTSTEIVQVLQLLLAVVLLANLVLAIALAERDHARASVEELLSVFGHALQLANVGSWQVHLRPPPSAEAPDDAPEGERSAIVPSATPAEILAALGPGHADEAIVRVWYSAELSRILGLDDDGEHHQPLHSMLELVTADDRARLIDAVRRVIAKGGMFSIEHAVVRKRDGARRVVRHLGTVVDRDDPHGGRIVGSVLDITDQREVELLKDSLIATASHELRTPLTSVLGFATTLGRSWDEIPEPERLRYLKIIEEQSHRLVAIVDDTLQQARIDERTLSVTIEPMRVSGVILGALHDLPGGEQVIMDRSCHVMVEADAGHLHRVITNLVSNAQKYGVPPIEIRCARVDHAEFPGGAVAVRVIDHGPGVSSEFEARMFERFTRGPDTIHATGTGLGLSIVQGLATAMNGRLSYSHAAGETVFELLLRASDAPLST